MLALGAGGKAVETACAEAMLAEIEGLIFEALLR
jgi:hypothetical protein